ncbi:MAG: DUF1206 domain-containing protein [Pseudohongiella sp.]|uniref:DUF1206 domain-containing protein n=1 Tax=Pseudohongiella sp. TaxID=1979412 RepID=UPI0034A06B69
MTNNSSAPDKEDAVAGFARWGYASRGVVYVIIGSLAALAALGQGGETTDSQGALEWILAAPLGKILLGLMALGLLGYAMWRCIQALKDTDDHGHDASGLAVRAGLLVSAITHTLLALSAANLIFNIVGPSGDSDGGSQGISAWLMQQPFGRWMVGAVGLVLIGVGFAHARKGLKTQFHRHFSMPKNVEYWAYPVCRFGLVARGVVFTMIGAFFLIAAYQFDADQAGGLSEVFNTLREQPFGPWLLGFMALGLIAFGIYSLMQAVYRTINPSS